MNDLLRILPLDERPECPDDCAARVDAIVRCAQLIPHIKSLGRNVGEVYTCMHGVTEHCMFIVNNVRK